MPRVVICDDEVHIRQGLKKAVEQAGPAFTVVGLAANGQQAQTVIEEQKPDIVLMDINMPGQRGLDVIQHLGGKLPATRYIVVSGYDEFTYAQEALRLNVEDYLLKPINKNELFAALHAAAPKENTGQTVEGTGLAAMVISYVQNNFADPNISLATLAVKFHVSESYLSRVIKKECGKTYSEYLNTLRLEEAKKLLCGNSNLQSQEAAEQVGYLNKHYFCRIFKKDTGDSPIEYQKKYSQPT